MATPIIPRTPAAPVPPAPRVPTPTPEQQATADSLARTPEADAEKAAEVILSMLPSYIAEYVREVAYVHNRQPLWSLVAGHVLKSYENGDVQAPLLDPSWPRRFPNLPADPGKQEYTCEWRGGEKGTHTFRPRRYKQRFCSNECGVAAAMAPKTDNG